MFTFRYFGIFPIDNPQKFCKNRNSDLLPGNPKLASLSLAQEDLIPEAINKLKTEYVLAPHLDQGLVNEPSFAFLRKIRV